MNFWSFGLSVLLQLNEEEKSTKKNIFQHKNTNTQCIESWLQPERLLYKSYLTLFVAINAVGFCAFQSSIWKKWNERWKTANEPAVSSSVHYTLSVHSICIANVCMCASEWASTNAIDCCWCQRTKSDSESERKRATAHWINSDAH